MRNIWFWSLEVVRKKINYFEKEKKNNFFNKQNDTLWNIFLLKKYSTYCGLFGSFPIWRRVERLEREIRKLFCLSKSQWNLLPTIELPSVHAAWRKSLTWFPKFFLPRILAWNDAKIGAQERRKKVASQGLIDKVKRVELPGFLIGMAYLNKSSTFFHDFI